MNTQSRKVHNINYTTVFTSPQNKLIIVGEGFKRHRPSLVTRFKKRLHKLRLYFISLKF